MKTCYNFRIIKKYALKYKRTLWIVLAAVFLLVLFVLKTASALKNQENKTVQETNKNQGLTTYDNEVVSSLVNRDTDGDGIPDWEEGLWGTDPAKKETTPGTPDATAIQKLKTQNKNTGELGGANGASAAPEGLTQTDKFSRELFSAVAALNEAGTMDQATVERLTRSLAEQIQNSAPRKVFLLSDLKIIDDDSTAAVQKYFDTLNNTYKKYVFKKGVLQVLQEFLKDENNTAILLELDPIIDQVNKIINEVVKIGVPKSFSLLHLDLINSSQRLVENINDIKLFDSDTIVAVGAISQYEKNSTALETATKRLVDTIKQKLNN